MPAPTVSIGVPVTFKVAVVPAMTTLLSVVPAGAPVSVQSPSGAAGTPNRGSEKVATT